MKKAAVIAVADSHGELIAFARMDGAPVSSIRIAANKAWTAARERKSTKDIGEKARHPEKGHDIAYYGDPKFVGWGGGIPVWRDGEVVGAVAVSGLSSSEDIVLATLGAGSGRRQRKKASLNRRAVTHRSSRPLRVCFANFAVKSS